MHGSPQSYFWVDRHEKAWQILVTAAMVYVYQKGGVYGFIGKSLYRFRHYVCVSICLSGKKKNRTQLNQRSRMCVCSCPNRVYRQPRAKKVPRTKDARAVLLYAKGKIIAELLANFMQRVEK